VTAPKYRAESLMKQDLSEVEAQVESKTRYEPDPDFSPTSATNSRLDFPVTDA
jgi:hypothetical protein